MHFYLFFTTLILASSFSAAQFSIGLPGANTRIQRGAQFTVSWGGLPANTTTVTIDLMQGSASALLLKEILGSNIPAGSGRTTLTAPDTTAAATNYFIRVRGNDVPSSVATQGPITIFTVLVPSSAPVSSAASSISSIATAVNSTSIASSTAASSSSVTSMSTTSSSSLASKTTSAPRKTSTSDSDSETGGNDSTLSTGAIAGIAVGAVAGVGVIAALIMCVRRSNRDNDDRMETASDIFSSPAAYRKENKNMVIPPPVLQRDLDPPQQQQGNYYATGYEDAYYNQAHDPYQQQYTQGYNDSPYGNYGYHPAAVYQPALASPGVQQQYQGYTGNGNQHVNWDTQQQYPEAAYYNSTPLPPQPRSDAPHSPNAAHQ